MAAKEGKQQALCHLRASSSERAERGEWLRFMSTLGNHHIFPQPALVAGLPLPTREIVLDPQHGPVYWNS
eukprot:3046837-Lingulodinium_polyedra.AAC.1